MTINKTIELDTLIVGNARISLNNLLAIISCDPKSHTNLVHLQATIERFKDRCQALERDIQDGKEALKCYLE